MMNKEGRTQRRGSVMVYSIVAVTGLVAVGSLALDYGRVQVARAELQDAADAAARHAVTVVRNELSGQVAAYHHANQSLNENRVDGQQIRFALGQDVRVGRWNAQTQVFTPTNFADEANAVEVVLNQPVGGKGRPLSLLPLLGRDQVTVRARAIARIEFDEDVVLNANGGGNNNGNGNNNWEEDRIEVPDGTYRYWVPATSNPWLAGMPAGTVANANNPARNPDFAGVNFKDNGKKIKRNRGTNGEGSQGNAGTAESNYAAWGDYAPKKASPIEAGTLRIRPGQTITFDALNGGANNSNSQVRYSADGNKGGVIDNFGGNENGMSNIRAPINAVIAVFIADGRPDQNGTVTPPMLDFSTASSRDFQTLRPALNQVFFIGDGRRDNGEIQHFVVPQGATRLFIGTMDGWEWSNNVGGFEVTAHVRGNIATVR
jgi:Flp pilus assembly protein TadG